MTRATNKKEFRNALLQWWMINKRDFPWRTTKDVYETLIAEIFLHRTRAEQVVPVYNSFIKKFPDIKSIAQAEENDVKQMLRSLGLRWRANLLILMAKELMSKYGGRIPADKSDLESLPGISQYIASAVRSFALELPDPILDTNTVRILGRVFGVPVSDGSRRSEKFRKIYESLIDIDHPRDFNFAMIDLAAKLCKPINPSCDLCPVRTMCEYKKTSS